jgi:hypothetical protein
MICVSNDEVGHGSKPSAFIKCGECLDWVSSGWFLMKSSVSWSYLIVCKKLQDRQCTYNVTLRRVRVTIVDTEKQ